MSPGRHLLLGPLCFALVLRPLIIITTQEAVDVAGRHGRLLVWRGRRKRSVRRAIVVQRLRRAIFDMYFVLLRGDLRPVGLAEVLGGVALLRIITRRVLVALAVDGVE